MKILSVQGTNTISGGEVVALDIAGGIRKVAKVIFWLPSRPTSEAARHYRGFDYHFPSSPTTLAAAQNLHALIRQKLPAIAHAHGMRAKIILWLALLGMVRRPKTVYTVHGFHIAHRPFWARYPLYLLELITNWRMDAVVCVSDADRELVLKSGTAPRRKLYKILNGIDPKKFDDLEGGVSAIRKELGLINKKVVTSIARFHPQKDFPTIIRALKMLSGKFPNLMVLAVGDGPLRRDMEDMAKRAEITQWLKFLGNRSDVPAIMKASDIVILSTNWEGLPLTPIEAGYAAKPVVASDAPGVKEVVRDGQNGFVFPVGNTEALASAISLLLTSPKLRQEMGISGRRLAENNFRAARMANDYLALYRNLSA